MQISIDDFYLEGPVLGTRRVSWSRGQVVVLEVPLRPEPRAGGRRAQSRGEEPRAGGRSPEQGGGEQKQDND